MVRIPRYLRAILGQVRAAGGLALIASSPFGPLAQAQTPAAGQVCFYENNGYAGKQLCVVAGRNNVPAGWNDVISSVKVPAGWKVELLADINFKGRSLVLTTDTPALGSLSFNDTASS